MEKNGIRHKFFDFVVYALLKTPLGSYSKFSKFLYYILFPLHGFYERQSHVKFEPYKNLYTIRGVEITATFIEKLRSEQIEFEKELLL